MVALIFFLLNLGASIFKPKSRLEAENAALRQQLIVLQRKVPGRVQFTTRPPPRKADHSRSRSRSPRRRASTQRPETRSPFIRMALERQSWHTCPLRRQFCRHRAPGSPNSVPYCSGCGADDLRAVRPPNLHITPGLGAISCREATTAETRSVWLG
jgi:hypothetical protein